MEKKINPGEAERRWPLSPRNNRAVGGAPGANAPWNYVERRDRAERRLRYDRRQLIRFEDDRRAGMERRTGSDPWAFP